MKNVWDFFAVPDMDHTVHSDQNPPKTKNGFFG